MLKQPLTSSLSAITITICSFGLLTIWSLPETIALRHFFLVLGFIAALLFLKPYLPNILGIAGWPLWALLSLYLWLTLHLWLYSEQPLIQFQELRSIWLRSLAALPIGLALGILVSTPTTTPTRNTGNQERIAFLIFLGFAATPIIFMGSYLYKSYLAQQLLPMQAALWWELPYLQKPPFVVATALLLPLCCALIYRSIRGNERIWWALFSVIGIGLCITSNYLTNTKNGIAIAAITISLFGMYSIFRVIFNGARNSVPRTLIPLTLLICILAGAGWGVKLHTEKNPAWSQLIANIKVGVDIDHHAYWKNRNTYPAVPINDQGIAVDISTYERTAWFTAGLRLVQERPQGYGLLSHSFGWMALQRWPDFYQPIGKLRGATHSGWMDLALGIGIPGLLLILIPLAASWYRSLRITSLWGLYATLAIPMFTLTYLTTETTGAHHFIELMIFMTAFFIGITLPTSIHSAQSIKNNSP